jgi:uncharacterized lipoprotein YehR (DUF1307 family)
MGSKAYEVAVSRIVAAYEYKDETWAKDQLDRAIRNADIDLDSCTDEEATKTLSDVLYWVFGLNGKIT